MFGGLLPSSYYLKRKSAILKRHKANKDRVQEYKLAVGCSRCGYNKCALALTFHHTDPSNKRFNVSRSMSYSWETLKREIAKCIVLCANCHYELHEEDGDSFGRSRGDFLPESLLH
jgi:hypothetical protein